MGRPTPPILDLVGWVLYAIGFSLYAFFTPIALGHPDNSIHANPLTTPAHIVPEWYFLAFYAILRSIPNKQAGVASVALVFFTLGLIGISGSDQSQSTRVACLQVAGPGPIAQPIPQDQAWKHFDPQITVFLFLFGVGPITHATPLQPRIIQSALPLLSRCPSSLARITQFDPAGS